MKTFFDYDDTYPTCQRTFATLSIYLPDGSDPGKLSEELSIEPSRIQIKGEVRNGKIKRWPTTWSLTSKEKVQSKDVRRHIDWILEQLSGKSEIIHQLQAAGSKIYISCFWGSAVGHGGPMLDSNIMKRMAELNLGISFDVYFEENEISEV